MVVITPDVLPTAQKKQFNTADLIKEFPQFTADDFVYFLESSENKVKDLDLPKQDCRINKVFSDCKNEDLKRREYCLLNCGFKCLRGLDYKKLA